MNLSPFLAIRLQNRNFSWWLIWPYSIHYLDDSLHCLCTRLQSPISEGIRQPWFLFFKHAKNLTHGKGREGPEVFETNYMLPGQITRASLCTTDYMPSSIGLRTNHTMQRAQSSINLHKMESLFETITGIHFVCVEYVT